MIHRHRSTRHRAARRRSTRHRSCGGVGGCWRLRRRRWRRRRPYHPEHRRLRVGRVARHRRTRAVVTTRPRACGPTARPLWILENGSGADDAIYAYDLTTVGAHRGTMSFDLDEHQPRTARRVVRSHRHLGLGQRPATDSSPTTSSTGERLLDRDVVLAARNRAARGIWSADETMWVLDGGKDSLFAYDLVKRRAARRVQARFRRTATPTASGRTRRHRLGL